MQGCQPLRFCRNDYGISTQNTRVAAILQFSINLARKRKKNEQLNRRPQIAFAIFFSGGFILESAILVLIVTTEKPLRRREKNTQQKWRRQQLRKR